MEDWKFNEDTEPDRGRDQCITCQEPLPIDNLAPEGSEMCEDCFDQELSTHTASRFEVDVDLDDDYLVKFEETAISKTIVIDQVDPVVRLRFTDAEQLIQFFACIRRKVMGE